MILYNLICIVIYLNNYEKGVVFFIVCIVFILILGGSYTILNI